MFDVEMDKEILRTNFDEQRDRFTNVKFALNQVERYANK